MSRYAHLTTRQLEAAAKDERMPPWKRDEIRAEIADRAKALASVLSEALQAPVAAPRPCAPLVLRLPLPPSTNAAWRAVGGRVLLSRAARRWKRDAALAIEAQRGARFIAGRVALDMDVTLRRKRADLSNALKLTEDALKNVVMEDDSEVYEITLHKHVGADAGVVVTVRPYEDTERRAA